MRVLVNLSVDENLSVTINEVLPQLVGMCVLLASHWRSIVCYRRSSDPEISLPVAGRDI